MMRVVVQIAAAAATFGTSEDMEADHVLYALCDDSTIWGRDPEQPGGWYQLLPVPGSVADKPAADRPPPPAREA